jgi:hypothetical protein
MADNTSAPHPPARPGSPIGPAPPSALLLSAASILLVFLVVPLLRAVPAAPATIVASFAVTVLCFCLVASGAAWQMRAWAEALGAVVCGGLWWGASEVAQNRPSLRVVAAALASTLFLLACLLVGKLLSRVIREPALVLPVSIVAAMADVFTVFWGPTGEALDKAPALVARMSLNIPQAGSAAGPAGAAAMAQVATIGLGDFIFLALFMSLAARFGFPLLRSAVAMGACAGGGIVAALAAPATLPGMPLLPYLAGGFVLANHRTLRLTPREARDMLIGVAVVAGLLAVAALVLRS